MNRLKMLFLLVFSTFASLAFAQKSADAFLGKYKTVEEGAIINIVKKDGKIVGIDPAGKTAIYNFKFADGKWKVDLYDSRKDMHATGEVSLEGNKLKIIGRKAFITKTVYWVKL